MELEPLDLRHLDLVAGWLAEEENHRWLDFGAGQQVLTRVSLQVMRQRPLHLLRLVLSPQEREPIGVVALSNISEAFRSATLWYVLGEKAHGGRGYTRRAVARLLDHAFGTLALQSVNAWAVETNLASVRVLERNQFRLIGRQRACHLVDGQLRDRLLFDILASEHTSDERR